MLRFPPAFHPASNRMWSRMTLSQEALLTTVLSYQPVDFVILKSLLARCHPPVNVCALGSPQTVTWPIYKVAKDLLPCKSLANIQVDSSWRITWPQSGCRAIALKSSQNLLRLPSKDSVPSTKNDPPCGRLVPIRTFGPLAPLCEFCEPPKIEKYNSGAIQNTTFIQSSVQRLKVIPQASELRAGPPKCTCSSLGDFVLSAKVPCPSVPPGTDGDDDDSNEPWLLMQSLTLPQLLYTQ